MVKINLFDSILQRAFKHLVEEGQFYNFIFFLSSSDSVSYRWFFFKF